MSITIRRARHGDIPDVIRLRWDMCVEQGYADPADHDLRRRYEAAAEAFLRRWIADEQCWIVVAVDDDAGETVGQAVLWLQPGLPWPGGLSYCRGEVGGVYTVPAYRRRGVARRMMEAIHAIATERGATVLHLETTPMSEALYRDLGYAPSEVQALWLQRVPGRDEEPA